MDEGKESQPLITPWQRSIAERICKELSAKSGYEFFVDERYEYAKGTYILRPMCIRDSPSYPVKSPNGRELGSIYIDGDLFKIYFDGDKKVRWPDDWVDPYPISIDMVIIADAYIKVKKGRDMHLDFMCLAYYAIEVMEEYLLNREDRMALARFIPAVIKDFNILLKFLDEVLSKHRIDRSEVELNPYFFDCSLKFGTVSMNDKQIVENVLKRVDALTELRKRFREWLPSDKRKEYYESTMLFPEDPFRRRFRIPFATPAPGYSDSKFEGRRCLRKWPYESGNPEVDREYEKKLKHDIWEFCDIKRYYNFEGYRLRLARKINGRLKFLGQANRRGLLKAEEQLGGIRSGIKEEDLDREDIIIAVDKRMKRLEKMLLEKIEFLKEDFPEMFKE
ncbi:MAG: hypothetical protein QXO47_03330 [Thermoproteota archaeon]